LLKFYRYIKQEEALDSAIAQLEKERPPAFCKEQMKDVDAQKKELDMQKAIIENHVKDNLEPYSKAICQHFCKRVVKALPRELRDEIYEYMITPDYIYAGPHYLTNEGRPCENDQKAHFWDSNYVGEAMSIELAQSWYRLSLFYFWDKTKNAELINQFMTYDRWQLGIKPNEHISRVRFDLGDDEFHRLSCSRTIPCDVKQYSSRMMAPLKSLSQFTFPNRVRFLIRIHTLGSLEWRCLKGELLQDALDNLITELKALRSVGHRFVVQWSELDNLEFSSSDGKLSTELWKQELEAVSGIRSRVGKIRAD
jgi:hypothetical protein